MYLKGLDLDLTKNQQNPDLQENLAGIVAVF